MVVAGVMTSIERSDQPTNITAALEALSPWLNKPRRTVIQIEVFVLVATGLLFLLLIFGPIRRRTNNFIIQGGLWVAYTFLLPLITYTLGLMQSTPVKSGLYPVWASFLLVIAGGVNSITAYDIDDNKQWKRGLFTLFQCYGYVALICGLLDPTSSTKPHFQFRYYANEFKVPQPVVYLPIIVLAAVVLWANIFGVPSGFIVNNFFSSKLVADYMKRHADSIGDSEKFDPHSMKGCKYPIRWRLSEKTVSGGRAVYRSELKDVITVETIWERCNEDKIISDGVRSRIKGTCLSYSLSLLLRRRFFGMDCAEASLPETRKFVLEGLLSEDNNDENTEAFRVIEVELGFLYDLFFTKYKSIFNSGSILLILVILKIIVAFVLGVVLLFKSPTILTPNPVIKVGTRTTDTVITVVILGIFLVVEIWQSILYLGSDWFMVSLACKYIKGKSPRCILFHINEKIGSLSRRPLFGFWQNKIGQYSLLDGSRFLQEPQLKTIFHGYVHRYLGDLRTSHSVKLPDMLRPQIISALKSALKPSSNGHLTCGETSLQENGVFELFSWTLDNDTETENMLIWHIATDYCNIVCEESEENNVCEESVELPEEGNKQPPEEGNKQPLSSREVATKLSRYFAYLMYYVPEFLPGNFADTKFVFGRVMLEAREALGTKVRNRDVLQAVTIPRDDDKTIFAKGLKLGQELNMQDSHLRWKVMAEFWAETIIYIAPSDNAKAHMERLAKGGEFLTHIWALLTHAGILIRPQKPEKRTTNPDREEGIA